MPLQNRVDPCGDIHAVPDRGMFTGNRGIIHDPATKTLLKRRWSTRAWIICVCEFPGRRREVMGARNNPKGGVGWTELFFLDEVTALAAGHRPCFYCRREAAKEFAGRFGDVFRLVEPKVAQIDSRLHSERLASGGSRRPVDTLETLPDGAMVESGGQAYALKRGTLLPWSFEGYGPPLPFSSAAEPMLITPPATVAILHARFRPVWHGSARA